MRVLDIYPQGWTSLGVNSGSRLSPSIMRTGGTILSIRERQPGPLSLVQECPGLALIGRK